MSAPWTTPELTSLGRLPMHSVPHLDRLPLDGTWRFQLLRTPDAAPGERWGEAEVPGLWTRMEGTWDLPHYTNVQMPFPGVAPQIPEVNPTGVYERTFTLPAAWAGRRVVLHVGAAESVLLVALNGEQVGVSKDSHLAAEFDLTALVRPGENTLRLTVVKWSDATYLEDQDQWWHGGITRSVFLYATDRAHLADIRADAGLADDLVHGHARADRRRVLRRPASRGRAGPSRPVSRASACRSWRTCPSPCPPGRALLLGARDAPAGRHRRRRAGERAGRGPTGRCSTAGSCRCPTGHVTWSLRFPAVHQWSAEAPNLYPVSRRAARPDGAVVERSSLRIGFRRVEIRGLDLLLNGQRTYIRGVNRHDFDQHTGRVVTRSRCAPTSSR